MEAETLACGTGAVAAALVATVRGLTKPPVSVTTSGGDLLVVHLDGDDPVSGGVRLEGNASIVYRGQLTEETILS